MRRIAVGGALIVAALAVLVLMLTCVGPGMPVDVFASCTSPDFIYISRVDVDQVSVRIAGGTVSSALLYKDYVAKYERDGTVTVGFHFTAAETPSGRSSFDIELSPETTATAVWLAGEGDRKRIY